MPPIINEEKCRSCGTCVNVCAEDVFFGSKGFGKLDGEIPIVSHPEVCYHCYLCVLECTSDAIRLMTPMAMTVPYK